MYILKAFTTVNNNKTINLTIIIKKKIKIKKIK